MRHKNDTHYCKSNNSVFFDSYILTMSTINTIEIDMPAPKTNSAALRVCFECRRLLPASAMYSSRTCEHCHAEIMNALHRQLRYQEQLYDCDEKKD